MIKFIKNLFCIHEYEKTNSTIASLKEGNDNLQVITEQHTCKKCGQVIYKDLVHKIEFNWYKEEK